MTEAVLTCLRRVVGKHESRELCAPVPVPGTIRVLSNLLSTVGTQIGTSSYGGTTVTNIPTRPLAISLYWGVPGVSHNTQGAEWDNNRIKFKIYVLLCNFAKDWVIAWWVVRSASVLNGIALAEISKSSQSKPLQWFCLHPSGRSTSNVDFPTHGLGVIRSRWVYMLLLF